MAVPQLMMGYLISSEASQETHRHGRRLRPRRQRPRRRAAEQGDEVAAAAHWVTSSARASSIGEICRREVVAFART
jgi:hypothetical protein